jgi:hypothetical protein
MATAKKHYFLINQLGQSAARRGPFESAEAAREWAEKNYANYPAWILPVEPVGTLARALDKDGNQTEG